MIKIAFNKHVNVHETLYTSRWLYLNLQYKENFFKLNFGKLILEGNQVLQYYDFSMFLEKNPNIQKQKHSYTENINIIIHVGANDIKYN